jgi:hypothetical protein
MSETRGVLVPREPDQVTEADAAPDFARLAEWIAGRWIPLTGALMVAAQTWWMSALLAHSYFWIEDFYMVQRAASHGLTWSYLMWPEGGHLMPVSYIITWILTRASPYSWGPFAAVTLLLSAICGLMLLRLLRTLFGDRPGVLLLLGVSLLSPLAFAGLSWWAVSSAQLPFQIAISGALTSHVRYLRNRRPLSLAATAGWVVFGIAGSDKGLAIPLLLFAITSAYLAPGRWRHAAWDTLRRYWREWLVLGAVMAAYAGVYLIQLPASSSGLQSYRSVGGVFQFTWTLITVSLIPGMVGGPWRWWGGSGYSMAGTPQILLWGAFALALVVFVSSLTVRRGAWRAWAILLGWVVGVDVLPTLLGRGVTFSAAFLGHETRYVMEVPVIIAVLAGLVALPLAGDGTPPRPRARKMPAVAVTGIASLVTATIVGAGLTFSAYLTSTSHAASRSYIATARLALAQAPGGTVIVDSPVPMKVLGGLLPGPLAADMTQAVLSPMIAGKSGPRFVTRPDGTLDRLMEFDTSGRLVPAVVYGPASVPPRSCWMPAGATMSARMTAIPSRSGEMRVGYVAAYRGELAVAYAGQTSVFTISKGLHTLFLPSAGSARTVSVTNLTAGLVCVGTIQIGYLWPSSTGMAIPALPASG